LKKFEEKTVSSNKIFAGKIIKLFVDEVLLPNGQHSKREIVKHPGAVATIAVTKDEKLVLVKQYRKALEKITLEIPAGKLEAGEEPVACARRELEEETGYRAKKMKPLYSFYTSPGFADEMIHLFWAEELEQGRVNPDQDEFVDLVELTMDECFAAIEAQQICDAKTILAVQLWKLKE